MKSRVLVLPLLLEFGLAQFLRGSSVSDQILELSPCISYFGGRHRRPLRRIETDGTRRSQRGGGS
jgi:hypothetical protein